MTTRLQKFQKVLKQNNLDSFIVTNPFNIQYLTGFKGISPTEREAILTVTQKDATLITARLYQQEAKALASRNLQIAIAAERNEIDGFIKESLKDAKALGFEEMDFKYAEFIKYKKLLHTRHVILSETKNLKTDPSVASLPQDDKVKLVPAKNLIENLRVIKSEDEISKIEKAQKITQAAFEKILPTLKAGQTELEIAHTLKSILQSFGANGIAFEPIIASGPNSGKPHHVTGDRRLTIHSYSTLAPNIKTTAPIFPEQFLLAKHLTFKKIFTPMS